jgi:hypothetical protein
MAISTLDGVIAGATPPTDCFKTGATMLAAPARYSPFYVGGYPGAASAPSPGLAGAALTSYAGQIPWPGNPVSGNSYLSRLTCTSTQAGTLLLVDRLWHNSGITVTTTTGQTISSVTLPARDRAGSTNGDGVLVGIEVSSATTSATSNCTLTYTNQANTGSKTATLPTLPSSAGVGTFVPFGLASGDTGVRSIQTLTLGTSLGGGTVHLVAYRVIAALPVPQANIGVEINAITGGFPRLYNDSVLMPLWYQGGTTAATIAFQVGIAQG